VNGVAPERPVPPLAVDNVPVTPVDKGNPVALVNVPELGVPSAPPEVRRVALDGILVPLIEVAVALPRAGAVRVSPAIVEAVAPSATGVEPIVTELLANIVLVTVALSPVVTTFPVVAGSVIVLVPAVAVAFTTIVPDVEPLKVAPPDEITGVVRVLLVRV
jgi:hypothetical protein